MFLLLLPLHCVTLQSTRTNNCVQTLTPTSLRNYGAVLNYKAWGRGVEEEEEEKEEEEWTLTLKSKKALYRLYTTVFVSLDHSTNILYTCRGAMRENIYARISPRERAPLPPTPHNADALLHRIINADVCGK